MRTGQQESCPHYPFSLYTPGRKERTEMQRHCKHSFLDSSVNIFSASRPNQLCDVSLFISGYDIYEAYMNNLQEIWTVFLVRCVTQTRASRHRREAVSSVSSQSSYEFAIHFSTTVHWTTQNIHPRVKLPCHVTFVGPMHNSLPLYLRENGLASLLTSHIFTCQVPCSRIRERGNQGRSARVISSVSAHHWFESLQLKPIYIHCTLFVVSLSPCRHTLYSLK